VWAAADDSVLVGSYGSGLFRLENGAATPIVLPSTTNYIQSVVADSAGNIWVGTFAEGLYIVDNDGARQISTDLTGGNNVIAQFEDSKGRMWVSGGQTIAVHEAGHWRVFSDDDGMNLYGTCAFAEDTQGRIWAARLCLTDR